MKRKTLFNLILGLTILGSDYLVAFVKAEGYIKHSVIPNLSGLKQINQTQSTRPETVRDSGLERAIIGQGQIPKEFINNIRYYYNRVDLNGDNRPEVLVHLTGQYFCGSGGCTTLIFQSVGQDYRLVSTISLTTAPIIVTNQKNLGWNNLITLAAGGSWGSNQGYYLLRFNGKSYPNNTGDGIKLRPNSTMTGRAFFSNLDYSNDGIALQPQNSQITAGRSSSGQQTTTRRTPNTRRSANSSNTTARPKVPTWNQFVASLEGDYINTDFDLPQEFRNGYVYRVQGANWVGVYILKAGLPSYPLPVTSELNQITDGERYVQSGQAIFLLWDLSFSAPRNANDTQVRFSEKGQACLRNTCLTARSMSNTQISRILLSERPISQPSVAASNTQRSPSSGQQTATGRVSTPRHIYRNIRELGMAQFLRRNPELIAAQEKLQRAAQGQYDIVNIPTTDFLTKPFTYVGTSRCKPFLGCERDPVSYADYLSLKLKLKAQDKIFSDALKVLTEIDLYVAKLNNDNRSSGRDVSQRIVSNFNDFGRQYEQLTQRPSFTLENIGRALAYAFEETRVADLNFIETVAKTGGKLGSAFTDLVGLVEILNLPELSNPEAFQEGGRNLEYVVTIKQKLIEVKDAFLARDIPALTDLTLSIASDNIKLIDSQDTRLSRSADAIKIREASLKIIERANFLKQSQLSVSLDGFDQTFLVAAQTSSTVEIIASTLSFIAPGKPAVRKFADKADAIRAVLFDSLEVTYKDYVRQQYELLRAYTNRNQLILSGFSSSINFSAQEVGQYLLISRTDVVNRRSDGTIAVSIDGVLYPP